MADENEIRIRILADAEQAAAEMKKVAENAREMGASVTTSFQGASIASTEFIDASALAATAQKALENAAAEFTSTSTRLTTANQAVASAEELVQQRAAQLASAQTILAEAQDGAVRSAVALNNAQTGGISSAETLNAVTNANIAARAALSVATDAAAVAERALGEADAALVASKEEQAAATTAQTEAQQRHAIIQNVAAEATENLHEAETAEIASKLRVQEVTQSTASADEALSNASKNLSGNIAQLIPAAEGSEAAIGTLKAQLQQFGASSPQAEYLAAMFDRVGISARNAAGGVGELTSETSAAKEGEVELAGVADLVAHAITTAALAAKEFGVELAGEVAEGLESIIGPLTASSTLGPILASAFNAVRSAVSGLGPAFLGLAGNIQSVSAPVNDLKNQLQQVGPSAQSGLGGITQLKSAIQGVNLDLAQLRGGGFGAGAGAALSFAQEQKTLLDQLAEAERRYAQAIADRKAIEASRGPGGPGAGDYLASIQAEQAAETEVSSVKQQLTALRNEEAAAIASSKAVTDEETASVTANTAAKSESAAATTTSAAALDANASAAGASATATQAMVAAGANATTAAQGLNIALSEGVAIKDATKQKIDLLNKAEAESGATAKQIAVAWQQLNAELEKAGLELRKVAGGFEVVQVTGQRVLDTIRQSNGMFGQHSAAIAGSTARLFAYEAGAGRMAYVFGQLTRSIGALAPIMNVLFAPILLITFIDIFQSLVDKWDQLAEKIRKTSRELDDFASQAVRAAEAVSLQNLKLDDQIAKLEGRPATNQLKEALLESTIQATELSKSLGDAIEKYLELLKAGDVSFFTKIVTGSGGTTLVRDQLKDLLVTYSTALSEQEAITSKMALAQLRGDEVAASGLLLQKQGIDQRVKDLREGLNKQVDDTKNAIAQRKKAEEEEIILVNIAGATSRRKPTEAEKAERVPIIEKKYAEDEKALSDINAFLAAQDLREQAVNEQREKRLRIGQDEQALDKAAITKATETPEIKADIDAIKERAAERRSSAEATFAFAEAQAKKEVEEAVSVGVNRSKAEADSNVSIISARKTLTQALIDNENIEFRETQAIRERQRKLLEEADKSFVTTGVHNKEGIAALNAFDKETETLTSAHNSKIRELTDKGALDVLKDDTDFLKERTAATTKADQELLAEQQEYVKLSVAEAQRQHDTEVSTIKNSTDEQFAYIQAMEQLHLLTARQGMNERIKVLQDEQKELDVATKNQITTLENLRDNIGNLWDKLKEDKAPREILDRVARMYSDLGQAIDKTAASQERLQDKIDTTKFRELLKIWQDQQAAMASFVDQSTGALNGFVVNMFTTTNTIQRDFYEMTLQIERDFINMILRMIENTSAFKAIQAGIQKALGTVFGAIGLAPAKKPEPEIPGTGQTESALKKAGYSPEELALLKGQVANPQLALNTTATDTNTAALGENTAAIQSMISQGIAPPPGLLPPPTPALPTLATPAPAIAEAGTEAARAQARLLQNISTTPLTGPTGTPFVSGENLPLIGAVREAATKVAAPAIPAALPPTSTLRPEGTIGGGSTADLTQFNSHLKQSSDQIAHQTTVTQNSAIVEQQKATTTQNSTVAQQVNTHAVENTSIAHQINTPAVTNSTVAHQINTGATNNNTTSTIISTGATNTDTTSTAINSGVTNANSTSSIVNTATTNADSTATAVHTVSTSQDTGAQHGHTASLFDNVKAMILHTASMLKATAIQIGHAAAVAGSTISHILHQTIVHLSTAAHALHIGVIFADIAAVISHTAALLKDVIALIIHAIIALFGGAEGGLVTAQTGGRIAGPGTGTSDSIPARLSHGEYVVRASSVERPGMLGLLEGINVGHIGAEHFIKKGTSSPTKIAKRAFGGVIGFASGGYLGEGGEGFAAGGAVAGGASGSGGGASHVLTQIEHNTHNIDKNTDHLKMSGVMGTLFPGFLGMLFGGLATGGLVQGSGTGTSDSNIRRLSHGEFVVKEASVNQPGMLSLLHSINSGRTTASKLFGRDSKASLSQSLLPVIVAASMFASPATASDREVHPAVEEGINREMASGGSTLPNITQKRMEAAFATSFSGVTIHTSKDADTLARQMGAYAFTVGKDIFFRSGTYSPNSLGGQHLLAHELTHVVQNMGGIVHGKLTTSHPSDASEVQAEHNASRILNTLMAFDYRGGKHSVSASTYSPTISNLSPEKNSSSYIFNGGIKSKESSSATTAVVPNIQLSDKTIPDNVRHQFESVTRALEDSAIRSNSIGVIMKNSLGIMTEGLRVSSAPLTSELKEKVSFASSLLSASDKSTEASTTILKKSFDVMSVSLSDDAGLKNAVTRMARQSSFISQSKGEGTRSTLVLAPAIEPGVRLVPQSTLLSNVTTKAPSIVNSSTQNGGTTVNPVVKFNIGDVNALDGHSAAQALKGYEKTISKVVEGAIRRGLINPRDFMK